MICDEAHRTTGVEVKQEERAASPFLLVHDAQRLRARKRLYVTATPRIYTEATRRKAQDDPRKLEIFSMDDEAVYGEEFFRMKFADAVDGGYLSDYRVVILQRPRRRGGRRRRRLECRRPPDRPAPGRRRKVAGLLGRARGPAGQTR